MPAERVAQLHLSSQSYEHATSLYPRLEHRELPPLAQVPSDGGPPVAAFRTAYADSTFDRILSHGSLAYMVAPLELFEELFRILKPGGKLTVCFSAPRGAELSLAEELVNVSRLEEEPSHCIRSMASKAWLQADDAADLLYMVGSFYFYAGEWKEIEVRAMSAACY